MAKTYSAVILAAGLSSRMGSQKALLSLGSTTVLERVCSLFKGAGIKDILVVTGHNRLALQKVVKQIGVRSTYNADYKQGMFSSIQAGVKALNPESAGFFLLPVDIALLREATLHRLLKAVKNRRREVLVYPRFLETRGHPPFICSSLYQQILGQKVKNNNLRAVLGQVEKERPKGVLDVPVADRNILFDMDTPEEYQQGLGLFARRGIPCEDECQALLHSVYTMVPKGIEHGRRVADVAVAIAEEINSSSQIKVDIPTCRVCGQLHDIAKGVSNHEKVGGQWLRENGFDRAGDIIAQHRDLLPAPDESVSEKEIVFIADKLVRGSQLVTVQERFKDKMRKYADDPAAVKAISQRLENAMVIKEAVEKRAGKSLEDIVFTLVRAEL